MRAQLRAELRHGIITWAVVALISLRAFYSLPVLAPFFKHGSTSSTAQGTLVRYWRVRDGEWAFDLELFAASNTWVYVSRIWQ